MKESLFIEQFDRVAHWLRNDSPPHRRSLDLEFDRKLWEIFLAGDSYYFILNHHSFLMDYVSEEVVTVLGYRPADFSIALLNSCVHPEDRPWFLEIAGNIGTFFSRLPQSKLLKYKVRYDIRLRKACGTYVRVLQQGIVLDHDDKGRLLRTLNLQSDVSHLKKEGKPELSFLGMDGEPSYHDVLRNNSSQQAHEDFTEREKEVLRLVIAGKVSKEIADILQISKQTVDTHRKNMLRKKEITNSSELIAKSIRYGWI